MRWLKHTVNIITIEFVLWLVRRGFFTVEYVAVENGKIIAWADLPSGLDVPDDTDCEARLRINKGGFWGEGFRRSNG